MPSPTFPSATASSPEVGKRTDKTSRNFFRGQTILLIVAGILVCIVVCLAVFWNRFWPFTEKAIVEDLAEASDSTVTVRSAHRTYFPHPGCVVEGIEFKHGPDKWTLITIDKLVIEGSYTGILSKHVPRIRAEGGHVFVPPLGSNVTFKTQHSNLIVEELVADGVMIDFASKDPNKKPLRFDVHEGVLHNVQWGSAIEYDLKFHNPEPPGEIATRGKFGVWTEGKGAETPISGEYTFERADLGVYGGVAGLLDSNGKYGGVLKHIDISGTTDVPNFEVTSGGHKVKLVTQYSAYVDGIHGDTFLKSVDGHFGRTDLSVEGSIARVKGRKSKTALLDLSSRRGRIEDILGLFVSAPRAPMSGPISLRAKVEIPPGDERFLKKVKLSGAFGIGNGTFAKPKTQKDVNELSAGARGEKMEEAETVLTDLKGEVALIGGIARFSNLSFGIPGAKARMHGTYNLLNEKIDLHGFMRVDTKISKTTTGVKSLFLKMMDPFFKKKRKGEVVPVHIGGTYDHPQFGLDLNQQQDKKHAKQ
jgi:hypothetical protein